VRLLHTASSLIAWRAGIRTFHTIKKKPLMTALNRKSVLLQQAIERGGECASKLAILRDRLACV
jgi:hypothetical protein